MTKDDLKDFVNKSVEASVFALNEAGRAVSKFKDESVLKIEIAQLKSKIQKAKASLGEIAYEVLSSENGAPLQPSDPRVVKILSEIRADSDEIKKREEQLKPAISL